MKRIIAGITLMAALIALFVPGTSFAGSKKTIYIPIKVSATRYDEDETWKEVWSYRVNKKGQYTGIKWKSYDGLYRESYKLTYNKKKTAVKKAEVRHYTFGVFDEKYTYKFYYKKNLKDRCRLDGKMDSKYRYDKKGRLTKLLEYNNGKYIDKMIYKIGKNGYRKEARQYNKSNKLKKVCKYKYKFKNGVVRKRYVYNKKTGRKEDAYAYKYKKFRVSSKQYKILKRQLKNWHASITR